MDLQQWKEWLLNCNFYYLKTDQNFVCVKIDQLTVYKLMGDQSFLAVLTALGRLLTWKPPAKIEIFIQAAFVPRGLPPLGGLVNFVKEVVCQGKTEVEIFPYTPQSRESKFFLKTPVVPKKNILFEAGQIPITKKLEQGHVAKKLDLRADDVLNKNVHRLYIAAAFALLHDKTNLGGHSGDYDIAAILVNKEGRIISYGLNRAKINRLYHAEICCVASYFYNQNEMIPDDCNLYVTMKPCFMCASYLAYYAKYARGLKVYYAHTDQNAKNTDLERCGVFNERVDRTGRALKLVPADDSKKLIQESILNVSEYLDTKVTVRLVQNLKSYDWLYRYCNEMLHRKEGKYSEGSGQIKPVEVALKNINDFLSFVGVKDFSSNWRKLLNVD